MNDQEVLLARFIHSATATGSNVSHWPEIWRNNGLQDTTQMGQTALRYSLAYLGYATAALAYARTPAYLGHAAAVLKSIFDRLVQPVVWSYWGTSGTCGLPWTPWCDLVNTSMAQLQANHFPWQPSAPLDDPVGSGNIMYSAHVASIGLLYETFSGDDSLSTKGWFFGSHFYTLDSLVDSIQRSALAGANVGFGVTCEPGSIFPACQNHMHAALRLHTALRRRRSHSTIPHSRPSPVPVNDIAHSTSSRIKNGWVDFAYTRGGVMWDRPDGLFHNHGLFKMIRLKNGQPTAERAINITGCAVLDAWTLSYLRTFMGDEAEGVLMRGAKVLTQNPDWKMLTDAGAMLDSKCLLQHDYPPVLGTSFFPVVIAQLPLTINASWISEARDKARQANKFMESMARYVDVDGDGTPDQLFYNASDGMALQVTANRLLAMALNGSAEGMVLSALYDGRPLHDEPYLEKMVNAGPSGRVDVREARYSAARQTLELLLSSTQLATTGINVQLLINLPSPGWARKWKVMNLSFIGGPDGNWSMLETKRGETPKLMVRVAVGASMQIIVQLEEHIGS